MPPIAAVREGATIPPGRFAAYRRVGVGGAGRARVRLLVLGLFGRARHGAGAALHGVGAVLVFFGVALFSAQLVRPIAAVLGGPGDRLAGAPGILARENATPEPAAHRLQGGAR